MRARESYFARSELSSHGHPADATERALLAPFADAVKPAIMDGSFAFPVSDGTGENREGRREALQLLEAAGYRLNDGKLVNAATGEPFVIRDSGRHARPGAAPAHLCAGLETGRNRGAKSVKLIRPNISGASRPTIST